MSQSAFESAKQHFFRYAEQLKLDVRYPGQNMAAHLIEPDRSIEFRLSLKRDDGSVLVCRAYRVQFNDDLGPYKGGLRFDPAVDLDEVKALAFWMMLKTALVGIPFGGGKGGVAVDYKALAENEKERLTKKFAMALVNDIGAERDIPAPDVNTGEREMAWIMDIWRRVQGRYQRGVVTGKPVDMGGSLGRTAATGRGVYFTIVEAARDLGLELDGASAAIQGFGNVGRYAGRNLLASGTRVVAVSKRNGGIYNPEGIDLIKLEHFIDRGNDYRQFPNVTEISNDELFALDVDILVPAGLENAITEENVDGVKARIVAEGANGPTTPAACDVLIEKGVTVIPDILANAGGVTVSYFEWVQNRQEFYWPAEKVDHELKSVMTRAYREVYHEAKGDTCRLREAAYRLAISRVAAAAARRGVQ